MPDAAETAKTPQPEGKAVTTLQVMGGARPRIEFDLEAVKKFGACVSSYSEMAAFFKCTKKTIQNRMTEQGEFFAAYMEGKMETCTKLRYRQIQSALAGDTRMSTWLGMQFLDQKNVARETHDHKHSGEVTVTKQVVFTIKPQGHGIDPKKEGDAGAQVKESRMGAVPASN